MAHGSTSPVPEPVDSGGDTMSSYLASPPAPSLSLGCGITTMACDLPAASGVSFSFCSVLVLSQVKGILEKLQVFVSSYDHLLPPCVHLKSCPKKRTGGILCEGLVNLHQCSKLLLNFMKTCNCTMLIKLLTTFKNRHEKKKIQKVSVIPLLSASGQQWYVLSSRLPQTRRHLLATYFPCMATPLSSSQTHTAPPYHRTSTAKTHGSQNESTVCSRWQGLCCMLHLHIHQILARRGGVEP